jgi:predicted dehydrogenase/threonine dehydrogenase-like Zn-dependent dehydrogenase
MLVDFGHASLIGKARAQPEKVRQVLDKIRSDGLVPTLEAVLSKLDEPLPLGYCNVGVVMDVGDDVVGFATGDRVISNGRHAEVVCVPKNLCCKIPAAVSDEEAAFTIIGAIGLEGIRLAQPTLGEAVVVTGLGLIGLVTVQLLRAQGCRVLGIDYDAHRLALAKGFGADVVNLADGEDPISTAHRFSRGRGVDAVLITASTKSNEPVHQAATMCRKRGRIVLVGVTGLELSRADFYEKELSFQVSCSYGPGRYDPNYEEKGIDYPVGFVRWTEQRNFEAVLDLLGDRRVEVQSLISHRFGIDQAEQVYDLVAGNTPSLGILLECADAIEQSDTALRVRTIDLKQPLGTTPSQTGTHAGRAVLGFIGSGNYATKVLIPAFKAAGANLRVVASSGGLSGVHAGRKYGFEATTTDTEGVVADPAIDAVVITTQHHNHAELVQAALIGGKHVFVEKPLALSADELDDIEAAHTARADRILMVGFNRRFAPQVQKVRALLSGVAEPKAFVMTVNAGAIPAQHWTQDRRLGGGRIVGEACHFIDLMRFLTGAPISGFQASAIGRAPGLAVTDDKASITLTFDDGSIGTILYLANGHKSFPKERLEVFVAGRILQLDNFRRLTGFGWPGFRRMNLWSQDKGQRQCAVAFVRALEQGGRAPIPFEDLIEVSRVAVAVAEILR